MRPLLCLLFLLSLTISCGPLAPPSPLRGGLGRGSSQEALSSVSNPMPEGPLWQDAAIFDEAKSLLSMAGRGSHLWVEMYEFGRRDLASDLLEAHRRGADVRLIVDPQVKASQRTADYLASAGVSIRFYPDDDRQHQIDHLKLLYTDSGALVGGMNWGGSSAKNHDYALLTTARAELNRLKAIFKQDWLLAGGAPPSPGNGVGEGVSKRFSFPGAGSVFQTTPGEEIGDRLREMIDAAKQKIQVEMYTLTDGGVINDLASAHRRGVQVEVIVDPRQTVNRRAVGTLQAAGIEVRRYPAPPGTLLHAKAGLFDEQDLILGSANWTYSGLSVNHELDLETEDKLAARAFATRFEADWEQSS